MSKEQVNMIAELFEASTAATVAAAEKIEEGQRMFQMQDGKSHPTWLLGHVAVVTGNAVLGLCLGKVPCVPPHYGPLFGPDFAGGQPVKSDADAYPAWDEILGTYKKVAEEVAAAIRELDDGDLAGPPKGQVPEPLKDRLTQLGNSLVFMAMHNTYHTGQMNLLGALKVSAAAS